MNGLYNKNFTIYCWNICLRSNDNEDIFVFSGFINKIIFKSLDKCIYE